MVSMVSSREGGIGTNPGPSFRASPLYLDPLTGRVAPSWLVAAIDELMVKMRHKKIWEIVDFCLEIWAKKYPKEHRAYLNELANFRRNRKNQYASTDNKWLRGLVTVPQELTYLLSKIADHKIDEYGREKFWRDFAKRYPGFRQGDKF
jgi:hypothetical protein